MPSRRRSALSSKPAYASDPAWTPRPLHRARRRGERHGLGAAPETPDRGAGAQLAVERRDEPGDVRGGKAEDPALPARHAALRPRPGCAELPAVAEVQVDLAHAAPGRSVQAPRRDVDVDAVGLVRRDP